MIPIYKKTWLGRRNLLLCLTEMSLANVERLRSVTKDYGKLFIEYNGKEYKITPKGDLINEK